MKRKSESSKRLGLNIHAASFLLTMAALAVVNLTIGPPYWVLWVFIGWAVGLLAHWWFVRAGMN